MMPPNPIRSVVVGTDLGAGSDATIHSAAGLARRAGAELHVVHAYEEPPFGAEGRDVIVMQRHHRSALRAQLDRALPAGSTATARVLLGRPAEAILQVAGEVSADLLILGPHRTRGLADGLLGSTADRVLRAASVPCLVLGEPLDGRPRRIVVPSDLTASARGAVRQALEWASRGAAAGEAAEVVLVHVLDAPSDPEAAAAETVAVRRALRAIVEGERERAGVPEVPVSVEVVASATPAEELLRFAGERGADLLVIGTRGEGPFLRALQGSVSSAVAKRADLPVLLVPPAAWGSPAARGTVPPAAVSRIA